MDEDKEKEAEKVTEEAEAVQTPEAIETETASETTATEENPESTNEPDYKAMYEKLLSEHTDLQNKYKERFSESADLSEQAQTGVDLANAIDEGEETTISDLFEESGRQQSEGLSKQIGNIASSGAGILKQSFTTDPNAQPNTASEAIGKAIGDKIGTSKIGQKVVQNIKENPIGKTEKYDIRSQGVTGALSNLTGINFNDLFENVKKGVTTAERNRNF